MQIKTYFHDESCTWTYVIELPEQGYCYIIDPVRSEVDKYQLQLPLKMILETHIHADHFTGAFELRKRHKVNIAASKHISANYPKQTLVDKHLEEGEYEDFEVISTPGHTPYCLSFKFENHFFVGDCLFMPDFGTGRCDFRGGSAESLFRSVKKIYSYEGSIHVGHDYAPNGREYKSSCTIQEQRECNIHINNHTTVKDFVQFREQRDKGLSPPKLIDQAITFNLGVL